MCVLRLPTCCELCGLLAAASRSTLGQGLTLGHFQLNGSALYGKEGAFWGCFGGGTRC